ncbi:MAG: conjugal transfer protein TraX [Clostridia bacterium]|nr:conjugal transfer protein TraX [Clostridia bacterium]
MDCNNSQNFNGLSANTLKLIAIFAMTVDHVAWVFIPDKTQLLPVIMHIFGRITAPVMCFFISEGLFYTKSVKKYILRLLLFAVPSHFAYAFAFGYSFTALKTSMLWTLAWGLIALAALKSRMNPALKVLITAAAFILTFFSDWYYVGVIMVLIFGLNRGSFKRQAAILSVFIIGFAIYYTYAYHDPLYGAVQLGVLLSLPLLYLYNGQRGKYKLKWLFYTYYPAHLALLGFIRP